MHPWGLRPRRALMSLTKSVHEMLPSVSLKYIGTWIYIYYEAQYSACRRSRFIEAFSFVNASRVMLPLSAHDSGQVWVVNPSP